MFDNIGAKIKTLTEVLCWIGMGVFLIWGVLMMVGGEILTGLIVAIVGCLASWIGSFTMYAIGCIEENIAILTDIACRKALDQKENDVDNQDISSYLSEL